jgi:hypothetical protein
MTVFRAIEHRQRVNAEQACAAEQGRPAKRQRKLSVVGGQAG